MRIAIIGYGTAGQAAALLLSRDGHQVDVFERASVLGPVGAGSFRCVWTTTCSNGWTRINR